MAQSTTKRSTPTKVIGGRIPQDSQRENRLSTPVRRRKVGGAVAGVLALIACPCHLPVTLALLAGAAGGSSFAAALTQNPAVVFGVATVLFVGLGWLAIRWITSDSGSGAQCQAQRKGG